MFPEIINKGRSGVIFSLTPIQSDFFCSGLSRPLLAIRENAGLRRFHIGLLNTCKTHDVPISLSCTLGFMLIGKFLHVNMLKAAL